MRSSKSKVVRHGKVNPGRRLVIKKTLRSIRTEFTLCDVKRMQQREKDIISIHEIQT